jgi:phage terminase large subunit-like protein
MAEPAMDGRKPARRRAQRPAERSYRAIAEGWEDDVLAGRSPFGELVRFAVERQRRDIENPPAGYVWNEAEADKACALAEELAYPKGPKRGKRFILEAWEVWLIRVNFGWVDATSGLPRFHRVSIWLPKGNGKSPLAAAFGLIVIARGRNFGAKVYSAAVTEKQASNVFEPAQEMLRLSPSVRDVAQLVVEQHAIKGIGDARTFERVSAEKRSADGTVGDLYIVDEIHQHPNRNLYDVLSNNASKVDGSRLLVISTAGTDQSPEAVGWLLYSEARSLLQGKVDEPAHFALIFEADRDADPWDEKTWRQANPNYGVSISERNFRTTAESARQDPTSQPHFFATRLGWWWRSTSSWMDLNRWDAAAIKVTDDHFVGRKVFLGLDYAPELDLTAIMQVALYQGEDGRRRYVVRSHAFLPEQSRTVKDLPDLGVWARDGFITLTPGRVLDQATLRGPLIELAKKYRAEVCLDKFGVVEIYASLPGFGITPVEIPQTWKSFTPAMQETQVALAQGRLEHDGNPVTRMCIANVVALPDRNGNVTPDRENDGKKIDLAVGMLNAMARASVVPVATNPYQNGGRILFLGEDEEQGA